VYAEHYIDMMVTIINQSKSFLDITV